MNKPSICVVSHKAYGAMRGGKSGSVGGVEWQTSLTARWLAEKGYTVSMLTWDEGGPPEEMIDGVRIIKICKRYAGLKGLRFFHPKWTGLARALRRANADVYYHNCGEATTGQIALWCVRNRRRFIFSSANDTDCDPALPELTSILERSLYRFGLRHADAIIVQTENQKRMVRKAFSLNSLRIPMPCPSPRKLFQDLNGRSSGRVLWLARVCQQKRPDRVVELAQANPDLQFDLVGPHYEDSYAREVIMRARAVPNITVHGTVPRERVPDFYERAACFCCTSDWEGFPNTFLEAWSYGLPIVSTFDPDGLISARRLGFAVRDIRSMSEALKILLSVDDLYTEFSRNARRYFAENHSLDKVLPRFEKVFLDTLSPSAPLAKDTRLVPGSQLATDAP